MEPSHQNKTLEQNIPDLSWDMCRSHTAGPMFGKFRSLILGARKLGNYKGSTKWEVWHDQGSVRSDKSVNRDESSQVFILANEAPALDGTGLCIYYWCDSLSLMGGPPQGLANRGSSGGGQCNKAKGAEEVAKMVAGMLETIIKTSKVGLVVGVTESLKLEIVGTMAAAAPTEELGLGSSMPKVHEGEGVRDVATSKPPPVPELRIIPDSSRPRKTPFLEVVDAALVQDGLGSVGGNDPLAR
ncbi:hypothetical protein Nepgr_015768 [Nepenthes gracilis]|uniref:Uncharacterized protein n=1 Tax=Nepenthes gracilis TaxID=150966 RepID=A0AAD3SMM4_NEPGR|nr:hypothetical protein Nepgr_015768 [Nepenthes gracilis]